MPIGFFNDNDLDQISPITFNEFNDICHVIDPEEGGGSLHSSYALGIENIKHTFKYPQYYNGLIALSLLFSHDDSYELSERDRIKGILQETKELAVTGYEDVEDVGINKLNQLITTLGTMSGVFRRQYHHYRPVVIRSMSEKTTNRVDLDSFGPDNRIATQLKAVDYTIRLGEDLHSDTSQLPPITSVYSQDEEDYMRNLIKGFQNAYISVTSGLVLSTIVGNEKLYTA